MANKYQNSSQNKATKNLNQTAKQASNLEPNQTSSQNTRLASGLQRSISRLARRIKKAKPKLVLSLAFLVALPLIALGVFFGTGLNQEFGASAQEYTVLTSQHIPKSTIEGTTYADPSGFRCYLSTPSDARNAPGKDKFYSGPQDIVRPGFGFLYGCYDSSIPNNTGLPYGNPPLISSNETGIQLILKENGQVSQKGNCAVNNKGGGHLHCLEYMNPNDTHLGIPDIDAIMSERLQFNVYDHDTTLELFLRLPDGNSGYEELKIFDFKVQSNNTYEDNIPIIDGYTEGGESIKQVDPETSSSCAIGAGWTKVSSYLQKNGDTWQKNELKFANTTKIYSCEISPLVGHDFSFISNPSPYTNPPLINNQNNQTSAIQLIFRQVVKREGQEDIIIEQIGQCGLYGSTIKCIRDNKIGLSEEPLSLSEFGDGVVEILLRLPRPGGSLTDISDFEEIRIMEIMVDEVDVRADNIPIIENYTEGGKPIKQIDPSSGAYCDVELRHKVSDYLKEEDNTWKKNTLGPISIIESIGEGPLEGHTADRCYIPNLINHAGDVYTNPPALDSQNTAIQIVARQGEGNNKIERVGNCGVAGKYIECLNKFATYPGLKDENQDLPKKPLNIPLAPFKDGIVEILLRLPSADGSKTDVNDFEEIRVMEIEVYIEPVPGCRSPFASNYNGNAIPPKEGEDDVVCEIPLNINHIKLEE